jgi:hypothetical protein
MHLSSSNEYWCSRSRVVSLIYGYQALTHSVENLIDNKKYKAKVESINDDCEFWGNDENQAQRVCVCVCVCSISNEPYASHGAYLKQEISAYLSWEYG